VRRRSTLERAHDRDSSTILALPQRAARVRDRRQRFRAPRQTLDRPPPGRLAKPRARPHPIHASWLNEAEIYFSVVQRKVVTPNDFADLDTLEHQLLAFGRRDEQIASPFQWKFTRHDLHKLLAKTTSAAQPATLAA